MCVCVYIYVYTLIHNGILFNFRKKKILPFAATWINLEDIIFNEIFKQRSILGSVYVVPKKMILIESAYNDGGQGSGEGTMGRCRSKGTNSQLQRSNVHR